MVTTPVTVFADEDTAPSETQTIEETEKEPSESEEDNSDEQEPEATEKEKVIEDEDANEAVDAFASGKCGKKVKVKK